MVSFLQKIISLHDPEGTFVSEDIMVPGSSGYGCTSALSRRRSPYGPWYAAYVPDQTVLDKQKKEKKKFAYAPLISVVVPAYRTPELFFCGR